jgi:hypothetical protein
VKIRGVAYNNRTKQFEIRLANRLLRLPYAKLDPRPRPGDLVREAHIDRQAGSEAFVYVLDSGAEGCVHVEHVLDYNEDPDYLQQLLIHRLTLEARKRVAESGLSKREIIRRLGTSATQFYRLISTTNHTKSMSQLVALLHRLECTVDFVVRRRSA